MFIIDYIIIALLIPITFAVIYLYFLAMIGILGKKSYPDITQNYDFLILVPAHNEEQDISKTLVSLKELTPFGKVDIAVIADNCTDKTADVVRDYNVQVLERFHESKRGKGYALHWAISQFNLDQYSAVVIIDADTIVEKNMLHAMAESFEAGAGAVQVYNSFTISKKSKISYLQLMANISENIFFYHARSILHLPILLRGTGMAIKSKVLQENQWNSFSVTEDVDYAVSLLKNGVKIDCNTNSSVLSAATSSFKQSASQKIRWASGTIQLIKEKVFGLIIFGIKNGKLLLIELGFSFFLLSRPLLIYIISLILFLSFISSPRYHSLYVCLCLSLILLIIFYTISGIFYMKEKKEGFKALLFIPIYGIWFLFIQLIAIFKSGKLKWVRTDRGKND